VVWWKARRFRSSPSRASRSISCWRASEIQADADVIVFGGMGLIFDDYYFFRKAFEEAGMFTRTVMFINQASDPVVERLLIPDLALAVAENIAVDERKRVLVLLSDMTAFADALKEVSIAMDQVPANRGYPGDLYSQLASRYEKACDYAQMTANMHKNASTRSSTMESQTLTNSSQTKQPEASAAMSARVVAVQPNLVMIEAAEGAQRPLTKNEIVRILPQRKTTKYQESGSRLRCCGCEALKPMLKCSKYAGRGGW
jgi:hypothetical protein